MLVTNRFKIGDTLGLKLVNGDEVIAKLVEETNDTYLVTKPLAIVPSQNGVALMSSMFAMAQSKNVTVSIRKDHIMMAVEADERLADAYLESTTGIQTVKKSGIIV